MALFVGAGQAQTVIEVRCKPHHGRVDVPVMVPLAGAKDDMAGEFLLVEEGTARRIPAQVVNEPGRMVCFIMPPRALTGDVRRFRVTAEKPEPGGLTIDESNSEGIVIMESGRGVATFVRADTLKPGVPPTYRRSCYLHPVYDLDGAVLTDDFPRDHFHHRGVSWAWPRVDVAGKRYDLWGIQGVKQRFVRVFGRQGGRVCAVLRVANRWVAEDRVLLDETVEVCAWRAGSDGRAIDVFLTFAAGEAPVTLGGQLEADKGYGGFNVRFAGRRDTVIVGPDGRQPANVNRTKMAWSDLSGRFVPGSERVSGLAIFDSPGNPGFPSGWSNRSYGYLNPAWPGLDTYQIKSGVPLRLRYRVWIHRGDAAAGKVPEAQQVFADPPVAHIVRGN